MGYHWNWKVLFAPEPGGTGTFLHYLLVGLEWSLACALCAWVIARHGQTVDEQEIRDFCKGQIAHYKVPRYVRMVEQFPLTATGKPQKFEMRKAMIEALGLRSERTA